MFAVAEVAFDGFCSAVNRVDHVVLELTLVARQRGKVALTLVSPMGTKSILMPPRKSDLQAAAFVNTRLLSVHFWGENPKGRWRLQIANSNQEQAVLVEAKLIIFGLGGDNELNNQNNIYNS